MLLQFMQIWKLLRRKLRWKLKNSQNSTETISNHIFKCDENLNVIIIVKAHDFEGRDVKTVKL